MDDQRMLVQQLLCKYPTDVIVKLEESKEPDTSWSTYINIMKSNHSICYSARKCLLLC